MTRPQLDHSPLDAAFIRARRLELGLSERRMAALLGSSMSQSVVRALEAGKNHAELTLSDIARICAVLGLQLDDVLTTGRTTAAPVHGPSTKAQHLDDVTSRLGAALFEIGTLVPIESLAATLDLTLDQVDAALDELHARLQPAGLCVHRLQGGAKVARRHDAVHADELRQHWRGQFARRGLDAGQVRLLRRAALGKVPKTLRNNERVTAGELVNAGLLSRTQSGGVTLTEDVRYSLDLALA